MFNSKVEVNDQGRYVLSWSTDDDTVTYFKVLHSYNPETGFHSLKDENGVDIIIPSSQLSLVDDFVQYQPDRVRYYRIVGYDALDEQADISKITFVKMGYNGEHDTIRYNESVLNRHYIGNPYWILRTAKSGERCPTCWDEYRREAIMHNCPDCNGTTYVKGVYSKIPAQISVDSEPVSSKSEAAGENKVDIKRARMSNYPLLETNDYIVSRQDGKRYLVINIDTTKLPVLSTKDNPNSQTDYTVSQLFTVQELERDHEVYQIDINSIDSPNEV